METSRCRQLGPPTTSLRGQGNAQRRTAHGRWAWLRRSGPSVGGVALALLLPKCPLCLAAWMAAMGVGLTWHGLIFFWHPQLRPVLIGLLLSPMLLQIAVIARSRRGAGIGRCDECGWRSRFRQVTGFVTHRRNQDYVG